VERTSQKAGEHQNRPGLRYRHQTAVAEKGCSRRCGHGQVAGRGQPEQQARVQGADSEVGRTEKTLRRTIANGQPGVGPVRSDQSPSQTQQWLQLPRQ